MSTQSRLNENAIKFGDNPDYGLPNLLELILRLYRAGPFKERD